MKLLGIGLTVVLIIGAASAQDDSDENIFADLIDEGGDLFSNFGDILEEVGMTAQNLTKEMIDDIRNVSKVLLEASLNPLHTFKVGLNKNIVKPFGKGIGTLINIPQNITRLFADKSYDYDYINYIHLNKTTPIKDQAQCGSCYAFAGVALVESVYLMGDHGRKNFSEQQIIDCSTGLYNHDSIVLNNGCTSGTPEKVVQYFNDNEVEQSDDYPYEAEKGKCSVSPAAGKLKINTKNVIVDNEDHLAYLLNKNGPLVVYIYAGLTFNYYFGGIYNDFITSKQTVDHAVLVVGLEKTWYGQEYWIIKNSWGPSWGDNGYIKFAKGYNIASMITNYVTIASTDELVT